MQPDMYVNLLGSTVEFKMDIREPTRSLPQALANMVRVSNNLLIKSLIPGKLRFSTFKAGFPADASYACVKKHSSAVGLSRRYPHMSTMVPNLTKLALHKYWMIIE